MQTFLARHARSVRSVLSGFDRLVFRGKLGALYRPRAMHVFLDRAGVRLLDYAKYVERTSTRLVEASLQQARALGRPVQYLPSSHSSKEDIARSIQAKSPVESGLICVLSTVEPCTSFEYHRSSNLAERGLRLRNRKCRHLYHYYNHPTLGFLNFRIQTWFPFAVQVCMNGREWLVRQLELAGCDDFRRNDNCLTYVGDPVLAQKLLDQQLETNWAAALDEIARWVNPLHEEILAPWPQAYYWCSYQTEWASDIAFESPAALARIYPSLVEAAMLDFHSPDVMRFLGRKCHGRFEGEIVTSFKDRVEGVRVKHWADGNSIKMYDKMGSVLRIETTIGNPTPFKAFRTKTDDKDGDCAWRPMRKGVADLHRRAEVSQAANENYLEALGAIEDERAIGVIFDEVSKRRTKDGRTVRPLRLNDPDEIARLAVLVSGEFAIAGFTNKDVRARLHRSRSGATLSDQKRESARISRWFRLLRDHGLIQKVPKTYRYKLTGKGRTLLATLQQVRRTPLERLEAAAA